MTDLLMDPELVERAQADMARRRFATFVRRHWHVEHGEGSTPIWGWHLDAICDHLEAVARGDIRYLSINLPPGFAKSLLVSVLFPSWVWMQHQDNAARSLASFGARAGLLCVSGASEVAHRDSVRMRQVVSGHRYTRDLELLGHRWVLDPRQDSKGLFANSLRGFRLSRSAGQRITGLRGHAIVVDDLVDAKDAMRNSRLIAERNQWFDQALFTRRQLGADVPIVNIQQRLHAGDLHGHWTSSSDVVELVIDDPKGEDDLTKSPLGSHDPRQPGELLCPELLSAQDHQELRERLGPEAHLTQCGQRPSAVDGSIFTRESFRYYDDVPEPDLVFVSGDMTFRDTRDSNYTVGQLWVVAERKIYLVEQFRQRLKLDGAKRAMQGLVQKAIRRFGKVHAVLVENTANGPAVVEHLRRTVGASVVPIQPTTRSKQERAQLASVAFAGGSVYFPKASWVDRILIPELLAFPSGLYDDQVDALSQFLVWLSESLRRPWVAKL